MTYIATKMLDCPEGLEFQLDQSASDINIELGIALDLIHADPVYITENAWDIAFKYDIEFPDTCIVKSFDNVIAEDDSLIVVDGPDEGVYFATPN